MLETKISLKSSSDQFEPEIKLILAFKFQKDSQPKHYCGFIFHHIDSQHRFHQDNLLSAFPSTWGLTILQGIRAWHHVFSQELSSWQLWMFAWTFIYLPFGLPKLCFLKPTCLPIAKTLPLPSMSTPTSFNIPCTSLLSNEVMLIILFKICLSWLSFAVMWILMLLLNWFHFLNLSCLAFSAWIQACGCYCSWFDFTF